jgi:ectoine hydroxylase-related dioxygenase (phytanoyl-CoA dioxygenase family)
MHSLTVISHIFNEEYLIPFWLEHHSKIFENGIIIDYYSTDNSVSIINKICPHWKVIKTKNINIDGTPNFQATLIDDEVKEIEKTIEGYKICLNATELLIINNPIDFMNSLDIYNNLCCHIPVFTVGSKLQDFYPKNLFDFFKNMTHICDVNITTCNRYRYLHLSPKLKSLSYHGGRHNYDNYESLIQVQPHGVHILHLRYYPSNEKMINRRLQIQQNIPQCDKDNRLGFQHIISYEQLLHDNKHVINSLMTEIETDTSNVEYELIKQTLKKICIDYNEIYTDYTVDNFCINYHSLFDESEWGKDYVMLDNDINLIKNTTFDEVGYSILDIENYNELLQNLIKKQIFVVTQKIVELEDYHNLISDEEHTSILNSMPYKKHLNKEVHDFCEYLETTVSNILNEKVKIFNNDLWVRICRPTSLHNNDFNPCHRDVYLDFYRNIVNIYLPIAGSNEKSSLTIQAGSHKWNENETRVTKGGAHFKTINKKYSVDAIVASKQPLKMIRPNPNEKQLMLFSPYLIHGCANNENLNTTRISLEVRFIRDDENGLKQEEEFNKFLKIRNWR